MSHLISNLGSRVITFYRLKRILNQVTPPFLFNLLIFIYRKLRGTSQDTRYIQTDKTDNIDFESLNYVSTNPVFSISASQIRHHGGQAYNSIQHHFVAYYQDGINALRAYYSHHQPKTVYQKHFIFNHNGQQTALPWLVDSNSILVGEHGLKANHGHSAYGPVSDKKIKLEARRLDLCLSSLDANGYIVERSFPKENNGYPRGYFLVTKSGDWVFRVVGGKHRVATLVWLGWENIPVCCEPNFPKCIFEAEIKNWPGVVSGEYTEEDAKLIFDSYFRDASVKLWK